MRFNKKLLRQKISEFYGTNLKRQITSETLNSFETLIFLIEGDEEWTLKSELAYFLATIGWETAWTFAPIVERRASRNQTEVRRMQDRYWGTGFYGRGYVQLTWRENYEKLGNILEIDLVKNPDELLKPSISYEVAALGMREGLFRSYPNGSPVKLSDYINETKTDFIRARNIINGDVEKNGPTIAVFASTLLNILNDTVISSSIVTDEDILDLNTDDNNQKVTNIKASVSAASAIPPVNPQNQPWAVPVQIEPTVPVPTSGPKSLLTVISGFISSIGITTGAAYATISGILPSLNVTTVVIACLVCVTLMTCIYIASRIYIKNARENRAASLDRHILDIAADPYKANVTVKSNEYK